MEARTATVFVLALVISFAVGFPSPSQPLEAVQVDEADAAGVNANIDANINPNVDINADVNPNADINADINPNENIDSAEASLTPLARKERFLFGSYSLGGYGLGWGGYGRRYGGYYGGYGGYGGYGYPYGYSYYY